MGFNTIFWLLIKKNSKSRKNVNVTEITLKLNSNKVDSKKKLIHKKIQNMDV